VIVEFFNSFYAINRHAAHVSRPIHTSQAKNHINNPVITVPAVKRLEAFSVDNGWSGFIVFLLGDPHSLEGGERSKDGTTNPDRVFTFWWGDDLDLHGGWGKSSDFLLHAVSNTWVHGGTAGKYVVSVQVLSDINIALHDGVVSGFMDTSGFHTNEGWLEESFWATESFVTDGDNLTIWEFVRFFQRGGRSGGGHFLFKVEGDVAKFFFDVTDDFAFGGGDKGVTTFGEDFHAVIGQVAAGKIESHDGVWEGITFIDWDVVGDTIAGVEYNTSSSTGSVEGENSLDGNIHSWEVEGFKHDLSHLFTVSLWVKWGFGEKGWAFFWGNAEFVVVSVVPDFFHIIPVGNDTVFDWVFQGEDTSLGLSFVTDVRVFLTHTDHNTLMAWAADDGWEYGAGSIITSETAFAEAGAVIYNQVSGFSFFV
jgi:hypothetical protein